MASVKNLKKDINYVLSDIIEECYVWQILQEDDKKSEKSEKIIDETIIVFDALIDKVHAKDVENKKLHFKAINKELEEKAMSLLAKIQKL
jgi:predicted translin family RNA/ssDNA-binding protein